MPEDSCRWKHSCNLRAAIFYILLCFFQRYFGDFYSYSKNFFGCPRDFYGYSKNLFSHSYDFYGYSRNFFGFESGTLVKREKSRGATAAHSPLQKYCPSKRNFL
jgi:hypothetical protein